MDLRHSGSVLSDYHRTHRNLNEHFESLPAESLTSVKIDIIHTTIMMMEIATSGTESPDTLVCFPKAEKLSRSEFSALELGSIR